MDVLLVGADRSEDLATRYLAAVARQRGHTVRLVALGTASDIDGTALVAQSEQPRLVGLSIPYQSRAPEFIALASRLRRVLPRTHITAGGHVPTFAAHELLSLVPAFDSVVRGEGELTLVELLSQIESPANWDDIAGLGFRRNGQVFVNSPRSAVANLDSLPFPARDTAPRQFLDIGISPLLGSRGCYRACSYCNIPQFYGPSEKPQRLRSVPDIVEEMEMLYRSSGVRWFTFADDQWFPLGQARYTRVGNLEQECKARGLEVMLTIQCRADDVTEPLFRRLREMGLVRVSVGIESGSANSLQRMNRRATVPQNRHALQVVRKLGLIADWGLMLFEPDSTTEDVRANLDFAREMMPLTFTPINFGRTEGFPGTPLFERLQSEGRSMGNLIAPEYCITDPQVELLSRLVDAALDRRLVAPGGVVKTCSAAWEELIITKFLMKDALPPEHVNHLINISARLNRHTLDLLDEMFQFTLDGNIYDGGIVNERAAAWIQKANVFDNQLESEMQGWRSRILQTAQSYTPIRQMPLF